MRWTSRSGQQGAIGAATSVVAAVAVSLAASPQPAIAFPQGDGPVVLESRGPTAQASKRPVARPPAPSKGKGRTKPANPFAVKPPSSTPAPAAGSKGKAPPKTPSFPTAAETAAAAKTVGENGQVDPIMGLGLPNPACDRLIEIRDRRTRLACEANGTPESIYPSTNYGFDTFIDTGIDAPMGNGLSVIVWLLNGVWLGVNFVLRCVFELLGLAFGLNPFGDGETMRRISGSIGRIYSGITSPWLSTLVVMAGIWLAYKGLIKREIGASVAGTLGAIAMLVVGLWIVHAPGQTVGRVANMSNDVSLGIISAPHSGSVSRPMGSFAEAMSRTWPRLIEVPFAGLNFSDVRWAMGPPPQEAVEKANEKLCDDVGSEALFEASEGADGDVDKACEEYVRNRYGKPKRVIDLYLRSSPNSPPREALWEYFDKDEADLYKAKVAAQGGDGVLTRISMLGLFLLGLLGAVMLLAWLALRLFTQAAIGFVLLLAAPFALFFPLLGDSGRRAFKTWGLTLLGATLAKVIYSAFLSIVLLGIAILGRPGGAVGFLLAAAFCWTVFLKRADLVKWLSVGNADAVGPFSVPSQIAALALGRRVWKTTKGAVGGLVSLERSGPRGMQAAAGRSGERRSSEWREGPRRAELDGFGPNVRRLSGRHLMEAQETVTESTRKYGERGRRQANAARANVRDGTREGSPRTVRSDKDPPAQAEQTRREKARTTIDAHREAQVRGKRGVGPGPEDLATEGAERAKRAADPAGRVPRPEVDRDRPEASPPTDSSRHERAKKIERSTEHEAHLLLHAAMADPTLHGNAQMAEEAQQRSEKEKKHGPRRPNVRRGPNRELWRSHRDGPPSSTSRKRISRGG